MSMRKVPILTLVPCTQGDQKIGKKLPNFFFKSSQNNSQAKNVKITRKLNLKVQNLYIKPLLKPQNTNDKSCFEAVCSGENVKFCQN